ncbi:MAG: mannitol dehydrogenase family protein [Pseudomonadota bacterium]
MDLAIARKNRDVRSICLFYSELRMPRLTRQGQAPKPGIVHIGPGAFFRAHQAVYTEVAMAQNGGEWGIVAVSLQSPRAARQLVPQGGVYTAVELQPKSRRRRRIGAVVDCLVASEAPARVLRAIADPAIRVVTLTVTEKGYAYDPTTGGADRNQTDIAHDIAHPDAPRSAAGFIVAGLAQRCRDGAGPVTILSCDNLAENGRITAAVVSDLAAATRPDLLPWIAANVRFPSSMVDRITPATTPQDLARLEAETGVHDAAAVVHEPFSQWVIEDNFAAERPTWEDAGAQIVADVAPFEKMKLRCLNGTHSALAYLGYLAGHRLISDAVADPIFAAFCDRLWSDEIVPTVPAPVDTDLALYCKTLMERYRNPSIQHRTWQIAMDGSLKLPPRIVAPLLENLQNGGKIRGLCLVIAGWVRYVGGTDPSGADIDVRDPRAAELRAAFKAAGSDTDRVAAVLNAAFVMPSNSPKVIAEIAAAYTTISENGARAAVQRYLRS